MTHSSHARRTGYLLLTLAMMTVGTTVVASKILAGSVPPFAATALRFAVALPVLGALMIAMGERLPRLSRASWALLLVQAGAGSVGYTTLLISGLAFVPAADAGIVIGTLPAMSALFSVAVLKERPDGRVLASVALATAGVMVVAWQGRGPGSLIGIGLLLAAVACESVFILLNKRMAVPLSPLMQATMMTALGLLVSAPLAAFESGVFPLAPRSVAAIVWYALIPTVGGFLLWYAGAARVSGSEAATFTAVAPLTAVLLAAMVLGEAIAPAQWLGLVAVAAAIVILGLPRGRHVLR